MIKAKLKRGARKEQNRESILTFSISLYVALDLFFSEYIFVNYLMLNTCRLIIIIIIINTLKLKLNVTKYNNKSIVN